MSDTKSAAGSTNWAEYLIYMEAGGELPEATAGPPPSAWPGGLVCAGLAAAAWLGSDALAAATGGPGVGVAMLGMVLGLAVGNALSSGSSLRPGAQWVVRVLLPAGIVLLGARLDLATLAQIGLLGIAQGIAVVLLAALGFLAVARAFGLSGRLATLLAVGTGICGGSAVAAVARALGASEDEVTLGVSTMALAGLVMMFALPPLGAALGLDPAEFGTWAGLTIQQTPQVLAAGFAHGPEAGEIATVVKLARIALLAPVVLLVSLVMRRRRGDSAPRARVAGLVPGFVLGLVALAIASSLGLLPRIELTLPEASLLGPLSLDVELGSLADQAARVCLVLAMVAVGMETRWETLRRTGPKALAAVMVVSSGIAAVTAIALLVL